MTHDDSGNIFLMRMQKKGKMISEKKATPYEQILCALAANVKRVAGISFTQPKTE